MTNAEFSPTPSVIEWARVESGLQADLLAKRLAVKPERLRAWESGEAVPTVRQVEKMAGVLHRPVSLFFMPEPPRVAPIAADYRRLAHVVPGEESPELRLAVRQMLLRRETVLNLGEELGLRTPSFTLSATTRALAQNVGAMLREALGMSPDAQPAFADAWGAWRGWRSAVEGLGILVFQFPKVALNEVRGLTLPKPPLPVVAINSREAVPQARIFTLLHEVVHVMLFAGRAEAVAAEDRHSASAWNEVERFAEVAASHAFVSESLLRSEFRVAAPGTDLRTPKGMAAFARRFWISPLALAVRLKESKLISPAEYREWKSGWDVYVETLPPQKGGPSSPAQKTLGRCGRPMVQMVMEALELNRISSLQAARYLDLGLGHFQELRERAWTGRVEA
jgi:Zn-dependent peptidase ImmA (M78 family)/transcriptional regulator with XRE-family HTH domain